MTEAVVGDGWTDMMKCDKVDVKKSEEKRRKIVKRIWKVWIGQVGKIDDYRDGRSGLDDEDYRDCRELYIVLYIYGKRTDNKKKKGGRLWKKDIRAKSENFVPYNIVTEGSDVNFKRYVRQSR